MKDEFQTSIDVRPRAARLELALAFLAVFMTAGCGGGGDDDDGGGGTAAPATLHVSNNGPSNAGAIDTVNAFLQVASTFVSIGNEGLASDVAGNLYHAGDASAPGSVAVISAFRQRAGGAMSTVTRDRMLGGAGTTNPGLVAPKGVAIDHFNGFLFVADQGAGDIKVFGTAAGGDAPPITTTTVTAPPWDLRYDGASDRLFVALTDGTVAVFASYVAGGFGLLGATNTIVPSDGVMQISTNLHGIDYDPVGNRLVVTDVGAATSAQSASFATDGAIYVFNSASTATGQTVPDRIIAGPSTLLGNPVDCVLANGDLYVAEKANDRLLAFRGIFTGPSGDVAPDTSVAETKPEAIARATVATPINPDPSDIDNPTALLSVIMTANPAAMAGNGRVQRLGTTLATSSTQIATGMVVESIAFDLTGDAFVTVNDGTGTAGGILVLNRAARARTTAVSPSLDRTIGGAATGLISPKGLDVDSRRGLIFVAENATSAPSIRVFGTQAQGNVAPVFAVTLTARPWDVDYDPVADRLFVAMTNGTVQVFDQFVAMQGAGGASRTITPTDGVAQISVNLHGIVHVASQNRLILSDVGNAADATDGQIFAITGAAGASGMTAVTNRILGPATQLGNPVDIAFDGANLYVAEKSNDQILRFDLINTLSGDVAPQASFAIDAPESVSTVPAHLSMNPTH